MASTTRRSCTPPSMTPSASGVSFWPIDARGLVAQAPLGDATQGSPGNAGMYTGAAALAITTRLQQSQDTLFALAGDTGGKALLDYNDLTRGIVQAQQSITELLHPRLLHDQPRARRALPQDQDHGQSGARDANLDYRQGYYAGKEFGKFTAADKERQLEDALMLGDPVTELTIAMEINYFQLNRAEYFVPDRGEDSGPRAGAGQEGRRGAHADRLRLRDQGRLSAATPSEHPRQRQHQADATRPPPSSPSAPSNTTPASRCCPASTRSSSSRATTKRAASAPSRPSSSSPT